MTSTRSINRFLHMIIECMNRSSKSGTDQSAFTFNEATLALPRTKVLSIDALSIVDINKYDIKFLPIIQTNLKD